MNPPRGRRQLLYLVLDGLGDEPCADLDGLTPLGAARIPCLDGLARRGTTFRLDMRDRDGDVSTSYGQFALFGYGEDEALPQRGPVESAGIGVSLVDGDVAFRANWATFDERGRIVDRRAGRIREGAAELARALDGLRLGDEVRAIVRAGTEHRVALVLRGPGLGAGVRDTDPMHTITQPIPPLPLAASDPNDAASVLTVSKLARFQALSRDILRAHPVNLRRAERGLLPANGLLTRRAGFHVSIPTLEERFGLQGVAIAGGSTVTGVMQLLGCETVHMPKFTANVDTDLRGKLNQAVGGLASGADFVMVHVKALDILAHDRDPKGGVRFLEKLDAALRTILPQLPADMIIAVGADHSTSSETGDHSTTPPPALLCGPGVEADAALAFDEVSIERAGVKVVRGAEFFRVVREAMGHRHAGGTR